MADPPKKKKEEEGGVLEGLLSSSGGGLFDDPEMQQLLAGLGTGQQSNLPGYIGGLEPEQELAPGVKTGTPIYRLGAEKMPIMQNWDKQKISELQMQMVQVGLLDEDYINGRWDGASEKAFSSLLDYSNAASTDYNTALSTRFETYPLIRDKDGTVRRKIPQSEREKVKTVTRYTNPNDLASAVDDVARKRIGRKFTTDEMKKFVQSYQAAEAGFAQAASSAQQFGGAVTEPMGLETATEMAVQKADPVAFEARNLIPLISGVNELLGQAARPMG